MTVWLDNQLPPALARWIVSTFDVPCFAIRDLGLSRADDRTVFDQARLAGVRAILTKDKDFAELGLRLGPKPGIVLLAIGNASTANLMRVLAARLMPALRLIDGGEAIVEIAEAGKA